MYKTAWSKGSSVPSDRLRSGPKPGQTQSQGQGKGKGKQIQEEPKSHAVQTLEKLLLEVKMGSGKIKDPKGGCFCLARNHKVSAYTPLCTACGLILCFINLPQYCCPHCSEPLLTELNRPMLVEQIEAELAGTIAKEIAEKERAVAEAQQVAGSFPSLLGSTPPLQHAKSGSLAPRPVNEGRTVVTLSNKKKITVSSYTTVQKPVASPSHSNSNSGSRKGDQENQDPNQPTRVPPPSNEPLYASSKTSPKRPWENLIKGPVEYVSQPRIDDGDIQDGSDLTPKAGGPSNRRRRGKGKQKDGSAQA